MSATPTLPTASPETLKRRRVLLGEIAPAPQPHAERNGAVQPWDSAVEIEKAEKDGPPL